jgi:HEAT repeat protein/glucose/arabinose dehydrogenase
VKFYRADQGGFVAMRGCLVLVFASPLFALGADGSAANGSSLPESAAGWKIQLEAESPRIRCPSAIAAAPDGTVYLGQDSLDAPGQATPSGGSVVAMKSGKITVFAEHLGNVRGLEWADGVLYVVHAPYLSAFRDTDGDGRADQRVDLSAALGPADSGPGGWDDHVAGGIKLGMDGYLYLAVSDRGPPLRAGGDDQAMRFRGGVIRIRPDGSGLEVVSTGARSPRSVALSARDEIFTSGDADESRRWPNNLIHHIAPGHYGYPYQFLSAPFRALPMMGASEEGISAQGVCYNEDGLPPSYRGNLFFCDRGLQVVLRYELRKSGATFTVARRSTIVTKGPVADFRPFALAVSADGTGFWLVDRAGDGGRAQETLGGRLYRLSYTGDDRTIPPPRPQGKDLGARISALDHPAMSVRLESQRIVAGQGDGAGEALITRLRTRTPEIGRLHALWALDAIGSPVARSAIREALSDPSSAARLQAVRSVGIRADRTALGKLTALLADRDATVRREAAIAMGKIGDPTAKDALLAALSDSDRFAAWAKRQAVRRLGYPTKEALLAALIDPKRCEAALLLADESWSVPVVQALVEAMGRTPEAGVRARIVANLAGQYRAYPNWPGGWYGPDPLARPFPQKTKTWSPEGMKTVLEGLRLGLADHDRSVRFPSIIALGQVGPAASPIVRASFTSESDAGNQEALVEALGLMNDALSVQLLSSVVVDSARAEPVRAAALDALAHQRGADVLRARLTVLYDPKAPDTLVARALPALARDGIIPLNDVAGFLEHESPAVRAAALLSLNVKKVIASDIKTLILARFDDKAADVRLAAVMAAGALKLLEAIPKLIDLAAQPEAELRSQAIAALCLMPDPRAVAIYQHAAEDSDPSLSRAGRTALLEINQADPQLVRTAGETNRSLAAAVARSATEDIRRFVLGHSGDARKGETLFYENQAIVCARCHRAGGHASATPGPDLSGVGRKYDKAELIQSVLDPAGRIGIAHRKIQSAVHVLTPIQLTDLVTYLESLKK